jgi:hypothetical protein
MAVSLTLTIGSVTSTQTAADPTKAGNVLLYFIRSTGGDPDTMTDQQKADWVTTELVKHMVRKGITFRVADLQDEARTTAEADTQF